MNTFLSFFSTQAGEPSSMRLLVAFVVVLKLSVWAYLCIKSGQNIPFSVEDIGVIVGVLGAKAYQKGKESPTTP